MEADVKTTSLVETKNNKVKGKQNSLWRWSKLLLQSKTGTLGFIIVLSVIIVAIFADVIAPHDPAQNNLGDMLKPPVWLDGGSSTYILGTDNLGRDMLSRIIFGTRVSLLVGVFSVILAGIIGVLVGILAGYYGGFIDNVLMRIVDSFLAIPSILFILVVLAVFDPSIMVLIIVIGFTNWVTYARVVRGEVLSIKEREYVKASKSIGTKNTTIMLKHIFPNIVSSFIVISTLSVATTIVLEASLSFLGLGIQPPTVSWGGMLTDGRNYLATNWWLATFPGIAITVTVLGIIFLGDWLRDVLDPRIKGRK
ncbi:ABC transporter permease [Bacillus sp. EB106-08-02-XG196]|jgi:peptide/nickel transport system permease protein|uniref:ABC transporter permease n=1 Tax=Bacillus sp. EB106-08-02-XG196 TaxID=2737049 RepID=UPI0015C4D6FA|nr:ABC transporter permease [Bacillus sp. EB106-08-02-XG196]NWQ44611.1 ABC transporter permease [Bacillus sp. EB106-08-02-XG196]